MPDLYIITGANGAGKSSVGANFLPQSIQDNCTIFDGDDLYLHKKRSLYKNVTPSIKEAGRLALDWLFEHFEQLVQTAIQQNNDFVYEGHLPEDEHWETPKRFKAAGYRIHLIFFGLTDTDLSATRVMDRAKMGGHNVPPYEIERNFYGNMRQLNQRFQQLDELEIVDTSESLLPKVLAIIKNGIVVQGQPIEQIPEWFEKGLPGLYKAMVQ